jgi:hypothetical protein
MQVSVKAKVAAASGIPLLMAAMLGLSTGSAHTAVAGNPPPVPWVLKGPQPSPWVVRG